MTARLALTVAGVLLVAGCGGSSAPNIPPTPPSALVLAARDLPPGFERVGARDGGPARFRRESTPSTGGPLVVTSRAEVFPERDAAERDLDAYRKRYAAEPGGRLAIAPNVGDDAVASTKLDAGGARVYRIAWRDRNVTAAISVEGNEGKLRLPDVVDLAQRQEDRIAAH